MRTPSAPASSRSRSRARVRRLCYLAVAAAIGFTFAYFLARLSQPSASDHAPRALDITISNDPESQKEIDEQRLRQLKNLPPLNALSPDSPQALIDEAEQVAAHLAAGFPQNPDAHEAIARFYFWLGNTKEAESRWSKCLEIDSQYGHALQGLASVAFSRGDYPEAVSYLRRALLIDPASQKIQAELGRALVASGKPDEAVELLEQTVQAPASITESWLELGAALLQLQEYAKAKAAYQEAAARDPDYARAYFGLATASARLGETEEAERNQERFRELRSGERETLFRQRADYNDLAALQEDVANNYSEMGRVYLAEGELLSAEYLWRRAASMHDKQRDARQALAWLYRQQGKPLRTVRMMRQLASIEPENPSYLLEAARILVEVGHFRLAERTLRQLADQTPSQHVAHAALAELYVHHLQQPDKAVQHAQQAAELSPQASHYALLSLAFEAAGDPEQAMQAIKQASEKEPQNVRYRQMYELMREELNNLQ